MGSNVHLSPADDRDFSVSAVLDVSGDSIPADFEVWQPPVENQGSIGNCVAQSVANIMECIAYQYGEEHNNYSVGYVYGHPDNTADTGMYPREACSIVLKHGDVLRKVWECLDYENPACKYFWNKQVTDDIKAQAHKISAYVRIHTKAELQAFMLRYNLPVMLIAPSEAFKEGVSGRHATVCYGWISRETYKNDPTKVNDYGEEQEYEDLKFTNSWGVDYHINNGRGFCKFEDMEEIWGFVPMERFRPSDIKGHWAEKDITYLIDKGIIKGFEDGTVRPDAPITRAEVFTLLARILKSKGE